MNNVPGSGPQQNLGASPAAGGSPDRLRLVASHAVEPAGFWRRATAMFIDGLIIGCVTWPLTAVVGRFVGLAEAMATKNMTQILTAEAAIWAISLTLQLSYFGYFYTQKGWSPGKRVMGMQVVNATNGAKLTVGQVLIRETVGKILSGVLLGFGYLMVAFRADKRALHDMMSGSQVLKKRD